MNTASTMCSISSTRWTFADLASTYRFWALLGASIITLLGASVFKGAMLEVFRYAGGIGGGVLGVWLGLLFVYANSNRSLLFTLAMSIVVLAIALAGERIAVRGYYLAVFAMLVAQVVANGIAFVFLSNVAAAVATPAAFAAVFAFVMVWSIANGPLSAAVLVMLRMGGLSSAMFLSLWAMLMAALLLMPTKKIRFEAKPVERHKPLPWKRRAGARVAIVIVAAWLIPVLSLSFTWAPFSENFFGIWLVLVCMPLMVLSMLVQASWVGRMHGELAFFYRSPKLLTPNAAFFVGLLVPMSNPVLSLILGEVMAEAEVARGRTVQSQYCFKVLSVLFPVIALVMLQKRLNKLGAGSLCSV